MKAVISKLFSKKQLLTPFIPENTRVYCIGDIHGSYELLLNLFEKIENDYHHFNGKIIIIYLGDFIDRGNKSQEVINFILAHKNPSIEYVYLRGNHEQTLLDFLHDERIARTWLTYGGQATLISYNVLVNKIPTKAEEFKILQQQFRQNLPQAHYQFLIKTQLFYSIGSYFFVHAGINPRYSINKQIPEDLLWIREGFIDNNKPFEKIIVHGHTVTETTDIFPYRIGIDTGAYMSGILTCLVLENNQQRLLQTGL